MNSPLQNWVEAVKKLSILPESPVRCPECDTSKLDVFDIELDRANGDFERVMYCPSCKIHNSFSIRGLDKMVMKNDTFNAEHERIAREINAAKSFAHRASREI